MSDRPLSVDPRPRDPLAVGSLRLLQPWAPAFASMPEPHLRVLGRLLETIGPLIETADAALRDGLAEMDGFDDLIAAGPLERLVQSELIWLRLNRAEFARRIVEREALRRRPEYRDRAERRAVLLAIDSGAEMLGRRRLVALAGLLALAAAARRRGARFLWTSTGFEPGPGWIEDLSRRTLSRFIRQTSVAGLSPAGLERAVANLPADAHGPGREAILWTIGPAGLDLAPAAPSFRLEIAEPRAEQADTPASAPAQATPPPAPRARIEVVGPSGLLRSAELDFPSDRLCADMLRAPFRAPDSHFNSRDGRQDGRQDGSRDGTGWAPRVIASEPNEGVVYARFNRDIVVIAPWGRILRLRLGDDGRLLGLRLTRGGCIVVWRRDGALRRVRIGLDGALSQPPAETRDATLLSDEHPLIAAAHPDDALPPLLRSTKRRGAMLAAPDGRLFFVKGLGDAETGGLEVSPVAHLADLRVIARADDRILAHRGHDRDGPLVLANPRRSERDPLRGRQGLSSGVRSAHRIGGMAGVLAALKSDWAWLPPLGWEGDPPQPEIPPGAHCLGVSAPAAIPPPRAGAQQARWARCSWTATVWTSQNGLRRHSFNGRDWSVRPLSSPALDGRVLGMATSRRRAYAVTARASGETSIQAFSLDHGGAADRIETSAAFREAPCVAL